MCGKEARRARTLSKETGVDCSVPQVTTSPWDQGSPGLVHACGEIGAEESYEITAHWGSSVAKGCEEGWQRELPGGRERLRWWLCRQERIDGFQLCLGGRINAKFMNWG